MVGLKFATFKTTIQNGFKGENGLKVIGFVNRTFKLERFWTLISVCGTSSTEPVRLTGCRITFKTVSTKVNRRYFG